MFELSGVKFLDWISHLNRFCFVIAHHHFDNVILNYCQSSRFVEVRLLWSPAVGVVTLEGGQSDGDTMFPSNCSLLQEILVRINFATLQKLQHMKPWQMELPRRTQGVRYSAHS